MPILDVQHLEKHFGPTRVLEDISFSLERGQALAIIGSSGSGKRARPWPSSAPRAAARPPCCGA